MTRRRDTTAEAGASPAERPTNPFAFDEDVWREPTLVRKREALYARRPLLTREEEVELAQSIEQAKRALLHAVLGSPAALDELAMMADELGEGAIEAIELTPFASNDGRDDTLISTDIREAIDAVRGARASASSRRRKQRDAAAEQFVGTLLTYGLSRAAIERLLGALRAAHDARHGGDRKSLGATIAEIERAHALCEQAKARFVEANFGLVMMLAGRKRQAGLPLHDLAQDGCIGLMRAVDKFDHRRGVRFSTYAAWWIRHAINRALSDRSRTIRLPVHLLETRSKAIRSRREFELQHGREPTEAELAKHLDVPRAKLRTVSRMPGEPVSMETPLGAEGDTRLGDFIADSDRISPIDELSAKHVHGRLRELLCRLPAREAEILRLRFGIDDQEPLTLKEIGERFSLSRERIRQIEANALSQLRSLARTEELDAHLAS